MSAIGLSRTLADMKSCCHKVSETCHSAVSAEILPCGKTRDYVCDLQGLPENTCLPFMGV
ncbi:MAG: hypothetical protein C0623_11200 [Desulfuromonas sp.]|nr:MAG: hypothetical protein C0623_11200 [Desulfuromonas sp.]